jgi:iron complex outermembrane recepter protein
MRGVSTSWVVTIGTASLVLGQAALAASEDSVANETKLEEVVVTANKRVENIQNVPISIAVVSADALAAAGANSTLDLTDKVAGLQFSASQNGINVHLRGIGISTVPPGNENSVSTYVDGVYFANLSGSLLTLSDIQQIEVDKGPQGTLFGRNSTGGVVNITTKAPEHAFSGSVQAGYGNYDTSVFDAYVTGGLGPILAANFAAHFDHQGDGYGTNLFNGTDVQQSENLALRTKFLLTPTDADKLTLAVDYERIRSSELDAFQPVEGHPTNWGPGAPAPRGTPFTFSGGSWDVNVVAPPVYRNKQGGASLNAEHTFDFARLTSISAYRDANKFSAWSVEPIPTNAELANWTVRDHQFTQELQLSSLDSSKIKWVGGLFYMDAATNMAPLAVTGSVVPGPGTTLEFHSRETTRSGAAFGQTTIPLPVVEQTNLTLGLRYTDERRAVDGFQVLAPPPPAPSVVRGVVDASQTYRKLTWRVALDHRFSDQVLGYISYNRGFKSGVFGTIPATPTPVKPEVLDAYEMGMKTDLWNDHVRVNLSGFYYDYSQIQVSVSNRTSVVLLNGAGAKIYGADFEVQAKFGNLLLSASGEGLHDKFTSFQGAVFFEPLSAAAGGGNLGVVGDAAGNKLPNTPNYTFNLGLEYTIPVRVGDLNLSTNYAYMGNYFQGPDNILSSPPSNRLNAQVAWSAPNDTTRVTLWARNLTNEVTPLFLQAASNAGGYSEVVNQPPRTYGFTIRQRF